MINLKKLDGPFGIPVYHQRMPEMVNAVSLGWVIFTGAADDVAIGSPGLHHWFEHAPFRGTKSFPRGYSDIEERFADLNGYVNAWTNHEATTYYGTVHKDQWREALKVVTDLVANPLLTSEGIEAERRVIHQEINGSLGSAGGRASYELPSILYQGHPFGHPIIGSENTLAEMDASTLRRAHELGYDRSRAVFVSVGDISEEDLLEDLRRVASELPDRKVSERRRPAYFGPLPTWQPGTTIRETEFTTSVICMLFPFTQNDGNTRSMTEVSHVCALLSTVFEHGGLASTLMKIVREERQLVYGCSTRFNTYAGGGYFGLQATAKTENIQPIIAAFNDVLRSPALRSRERLVGMKSCLKAEIEMMPLDPETFRDKAISQFINTGGVMENFQTSIDWWNSVTGEDVDVALSQLRPDEARIVVFKGMRKS
jgi:predicted Zn-dependent peptidase